MSTISRQLLLDAVKARLATIRTAAGYYTDIGATVSEWRVTAFDEGELNAVTVRDPEDLPIAGTIQGMNAVMDRHLTVVIGLPFWGGSAEAAAVVRKAVADVYKAIGASDGIYPGEQWGGLAMQTEDLGNTLVVRQEDQKVVGVDITIRIQYRTTKWQES